MIEDELTVQHTVHEITFDVPTTGFWQAHCHAPEFYGSRIIDLLAGQSFSCGRDLYGGAGVPSAALRKLVDEEGSILSVEGFAAAATVGCKTFIATDHSENVTPAAPVRFATGDVIKVVRHEVANEETPNPDIVVLDPPRSGVGKDAVAATAEAKPRVVVHFGCDPVTFACDARYWTDYGYVLRHLEVMDAFGLTHHFETIAVLEQLQLERVPYGHKDAGTDHVGKQMCLPQAEALFAEVSGDFYNDQQAVSVVVVVAENE